jgi:Na+-driven multidrug efflux pump
MSHFSKIKHIILYFSCVSLVVWVYMWVSSTINSGTVYDTKIMVFINIIKICVFRIYLYYFTNNISNLSIFKLCKPRNDWWQHIFIEFYLLKF